ncbi:MAG TPA: acetyl-CoA hydrolase/transferase C-terminal domain-containing protein [Mycobacteriales bacterium]|jgi:acyl-CoA hydrolase|nr:acetyl-CoA hydrolase/transferase C-terminal domain-containing protein [Mycobacteriales bacterium]
MRTVTPDELQSRLQALPAAEPRVVVSGNHAIPWQALKAVDQALERYRLFALNAPAGVPDRTGVVLETAFVGPGMRGRPSLAYFPCRLSLVPTLLKRRIPPDVVVVHTAPPRDGKLSLGVEVNILPAAIEAARARGGLVVAEVNPQMPYLSGDALLPVEDVDLAVEVDAPLGELPRPAISDLQRVIGEHVASLVPDGATLQLGIGAIPDAALAALHRRRELRIWSEMISDGVMHLSQGGALADGHITTSFAAGSSSFYAWLADNSKVVMCRTERANDPAVIAQQPTMTSINAALQVDLFAQANASYVHDRIYSGFGGQTDFIVGAVHSVDGHAIIALPSWHERSQSSTIVDRLASPATSFQHSYVVTEQGIATIWGRPQKEQAEQLIDHAAAPQARDELRAAARQLF